MTPWHKMQSLTRLSHPTTHYRGIKYCMKRWSKIRCKMFSRWKILCRVPKIRHYTAVRHEHCTGDSSQGQGCPHPSPWHSPPASCHSLPWLLGRLSLLPDSALVSVTVSSLWSEDTHIVEKEWTQRRFQPKTHFSEFVKIWIRNRCSPGQGELTYFSASAGEVIKIKQAKNL